MKIYSLDVLLFLFGTSLLFHGLLLPDLHIGFSRGRSGGLVFPSLSEFPRFIVVHTVKGFGIVNKAEIDAGQRLIEFCQENALVIANTLFQQHKRRLYTWTSQDGQHRNQIDYILCGQR